MNPIDRIPAHASPFDGIRRVDDDGSEWWSARDLMPLLGYGADWRNFDDAIDRAHCSAENAGHDVTGLFVAVTEKSGGRPRGDYRLARFAAYLVAMNGDPRKSKVAEAQTYFAVRTRQAELAQHHEIPQTLADALEFAAKKVRALEAAEARNAELEPDAARARRTMDADGLALVGTVAKRFGIQEKALRQFLHAEGLLIRDGNRRNEPYARYVESGHFELKITLVGEDPDRPLKEKSTTVVTPKGEALIWKRLFDAGYVSSPVPPPRQLELVLANVAPLRLPLGPVGTPGGVA